MPIASRPSLSLPAPLRAADQPSFTHYSVVTRLPDIARRTLEDNHFSGETARGIQALIEEIPAGKVRAVDLGSRACPEDAWDEWIEPYLGMNWLEIPWFFAEEYFYLRILEATGYFAEGGGWRRDPYAQQKQLGLESTRAQLRTLAEKTGQALCQAAPSREWLSRMILADLWGNQNDLSMWPVLKDAAGSSQHGSEKGGSAADADETLHAAQERILDNQLESVLDYLESRDPAQTRVDILLDNAGYELAADLALADTLLSSGRAAEVVLHAKCHPVFVSDALEHDIHDTLDYLTFEGQPATQAMAIRLRCGLVDRRLRLERHAFWTSPLPAWEMPADLLEALAPTSLLIVKGDANYRRLLGDRHWPYDLPFAEVVDYLPFAVLALRTLKSEIMTGVGNGRIPQDDSDWMINGRWGLVQFAQPAEKNGS